MSGQTFEEFVRQEIDFLLDMHEGSPQQAVRNDLVEWVVQLFGPDADD